MGQQEDLYFDWVQNPTPEAMNKLITELDPVFISEAERNVGPTPLLKAKARALGVDAIHSYDPTKGTTLKTWVTTNMKPLSRYSHRLRPVSISEQMARQAAELQSRRAELEERLGRDPNDTELADFVGMPKARIRKLREAVRPHAADSQFITQTDEGEEYTPPGYTPRNVTDAASSLVYDSLGPREKAVFRYKTGIFGDSVLSNAEIARKLGVSPAMVSKISAQIAETIKQTRTYGI